MRRLLLAALLACSIPLPVRAEDSLDRALAQIGLTKQTARFDPGDMSNFGPTELKLPLFEALIWDPWKAPSYSEAIARHALGAAGSLHQLTWLGANRLGRSLRRGWLDDPLEGIKKTLDAQATPLDYAFIDLLTRTGHPPSEAEKAAIRKQAETIPPEVGKAAASIILETRGAEKWRRLALGDLADRYPGEGGDKGSTLPFDLERGEPPRFDTRMHEALHQVDLNFLIAGAEDLALAVDRAIASLKDFTTDKDFRLRVDTDLGAVIIKGAANDTYPESLNALLVIDCGGNDRYGQVAASSPKTPCSVLIDLAGDDTYDCRAKDAAAFGAGEMGYAFLVDCAGNDTYRGGRAGQGAGLFGVGLLLDKAGNEQYVGRQWCQGAAQVGIGILSDLGGDDRYECYQCAQGFGATLGMGALLDATGADTYVANDTDIAYPSPQTKEHNCSLAQGCGDGRRADYIDGHSLAGGVGLLVDGAGDDHYSCGLFGQGAGYWCGVGMLADLGGSDEYKGVWYTQASAAHFAVGILLDTEGHDHYLATHNMAQGAGHDFSLGFLIDGGGNDLYEAPNLSLGGGNANGIGIFWDRGGDDTYRSSGTTLGKGNPAEQPASLRNLMLCLGVFIDEGGKDTYPEALPFTKDGSIWTQPPAGQPPVGAEKGVGVDAE